MLVKDMPPAIEEACIERGNSPNDDLTPEKAIAEWSGWHLGDPYWGDTIVYLYKEMINNKQEH
jgi:hypothetical protein